MSNVPFRVLQQYLRSIDKTYTQEKIAECLNVSYGSVRTWCSKKYTSGKTDAEDIFNAFFDEVSVTLGFIMHLKNMGYDIPEHLVDSLEDSDRDFITFLSDFLLGYVSQKSEKNVVSQKDKARVLKKYTANDDGYFSQTIYANCSVKPVFKILANYDYSDKDFKKLDEFRRILIVAPGGQGKSLFLKRFEEKAVGSKHYKQVIHLTLTDLFALSQEELICDSKAKYLIGQMNKYVGNIDGLMAALVKKEKKSKSILILLDGLNEVFALADFKKIQTVLAELEYITQEWSNAQIILTTRELKETPAFLSSFSICTLSGTPKEKIEELFLRNSYIDENIKEFAEIPMYYNVISKISDAEQVKTKYDILFRLYLERYNQSFKDVDSFFAFFVIAPFIAREIHDNNKNSISLNRAKEIAYNLKNMDFNLLIEQVQKTCGMPYSICEPNIDNSCSILFHNGPMQFSGNGNSGLFIFNNGEYKIFHDDIRDFILAFSAITKLNAIRESVENGRFNSVKDIYLDLNLKDEPVSLIKSKLMISCGEDITNKIADWYSILYTGQVTPQAILFAHTLYLISDYLDLGETAVGPTHNVLIKFTERIVRIVKQGNLVHCLEDNKSLIDEVQQLRCKQALLDIISKHCEYYRRNGEYIKGIELTNIAELIQSGNDAISNQKGKLMLQLYQAYAKNRENYELANIGIADYTELYMEGMRILNNAASNKFNLSVNLVAMLCSVPAPFLFNDPTIKVEFDFIKAFNLYISSIFRENYTTKEISYTVRQAVGLLLKGYVKFNPDFEVYEGGNPGNNSVVPGDKNTLELDGNTVLMAKQLLEFVDGMTLPMLNYYRGIVAYYDNNLSAAKKFFDNESDILLSSIFQHYVFGTDIALNSLYQNISDKMYEASRDAIDRCHPIYWYCDAKNLELAFDKSRSSFFEEFERAFPEIWKKIVKQLTQ